MRTYAHSPPPRHCPRIDIVLQPLERGVGMCTDVALYVLHAGARILPGGLDGSAAQVLNASRVDAELAQGVLASAASCGARTAHLHLETLYPAYVERMPPGVLNLMLPNSEHMWAEGTRLHAHMDAFLCKTRFCERLLRAYVAAQGWGATVHYLGHTSSDPAVRDGSDWGADDGEAVAGALKQAAAADAVQVAGGESLAAPPARQRFLHVKGAVVAACEGRRAGGRMATDAYNAQLC
jgi:hypothetical protein